eukprot:748272-Hanusia_phi.AAC.7
MDDIFEKLPVIDPAGQLNFTVRANKFGTVVFAVTLQDDGGRDYGGQDSFTLPFQLDIILPSSLSSFWGIDFLSNLRIFENSGRHNIYFYRQITTSSDIPPRIPIFKNFSYESAYFEDMPTIERNMIHFKARRDVFGNTSIVFSIEEEAEFDAVNNYTFSGRKEFELHIEIVHVNVPPSFLLKDPRLAINETVYFDGRLLSLSSFAVDILSGPNISFGPKGENWPEEGQLLTFQVTPESLVFVEQPLLSSNGTLTFSLKRNMNGMVRLNVLLQDDGGTLLGGRDFSLLHNFTIDVLPVNDPPDFTIECEPSSFIDISCTTSCPHGRYYKDPQESFLLLTEQGALNVSIAEATKQMEQLDHDMTFGLISRNYFLEQYKLFKDDLDRANNRLDYINLLLANDRCQIDITVEESCFHCSQAADGCAQGISFSHLATSIKPSIFSSADEMIQKLSFTFTEIGDPLGHAVIFSSGPTISDSTGDLNACLRDAANGQKTFSVYLQDDGGVDRGGIDAQGPVFMTIRVLPINQPPSFQICDACLPSEHSAVGKCCQEQDAEVVFQDLTCDSTSYDSPSCLATLQVPTFEESRAHLILRIVVENINFDGLDEFIERITLNDEVLITSYDPARQECGSFSQLEFPLEKFGVVNVSLFTNLKFFRFDQTCSGKTLNARVQVVSKPLKHQFVIWKSTTNKTVQKLYENFNVNILKGQAFQDGSDSESNQNI